MLCIAWSCNVSTATVERSKSCKLQHLLVLKRFRCSYLQCLLVLESFKCCKLRCLLVLRHFSCGTLQQCCKLTASAGFRKTSNAANYGIRWSCKTSEVERCRCCKLQHLLVLRLFKCCECFKITASGIATLHSLNRFPRKRGGCWS